ncbi:MAG TPA: DNA-binding response regulator [Crocinitomicaceae bacterium]|nr:DNA-binding response regulator [Flavobacteriales bacterium]HBW86792.1 DNA-binding response regulator [Crocinitomicaceae bacterium]
MEIKILLAEDDINLGFVIADQLRGVGYRVSLATDGAEALKRFSEELFHLCIFDVMMPKKDGFTLAKDIRKINKNIPILFLTAKTMTEDKIEGFSAGGDDYLTKPFASEELNLRVKSLLKRINVSMDESEEKILFVGIFQLDTENLKLKSAATETNLTKKEVQILKLLLKFRNQVLPRDVILNTVWGQDDYFVGRSLDVFITKLRRYLRPDANIAILNIHGVGFKLEEKK